MEKEPRDNELILGFFDRSLTADEHHELEYRLKEEPTLKSLFKEQQLLIAGMRYAQLKKKLEQIKIIESATSTASDKGLRKMWKPMAMAASIVLLVSIAYIMVRPSAPETERLYAAYFEPFDSPGNGLTRSPDDQVTLKSQAYAAYDAGNYEEASKLFEEALFGTDDAIMHLCLGNTFLMLDRPSDAEKNFRHILNDHVDLVTQAKWYMALTYLKQNKIELTKANLWEISNSSTYGEKARKLLKELE